MEFQPFNSEWEKDMNKLSKQKMEMIFKFSGQGLNKQQLIKIIRANLIVKQFNENYPIGSTVNYMPISENSSCIQKLTVKSQAYILNGLPVVFFNEKPACCSAEPSHIFLQ